MAYKVNAYYDGPKNDPKKSISKLFLVLSSHLKWVFRFCKNYVLYIFSTTLLNTFNENTWIKLKKYILKSTCEFWPSKKILKYPLSLIMTFLIRILVSILTIWFVTKYYQTNNLITQDLWVHLHLFKDQVRIVIKFKTQVLKCPLNQKMNIWFFFFNMLFLW